MDFRLFRLATFFLLAAAAPFAAFADDDAFGLPDFDLTNAANAEVTDGVVFRPGKGLQITSKDGRFQIQTRVRAQFLYTLQHEPGDDGPVLENGFQIRRARLVFAGHLFGKKNTYKLEIAVSPKDIGLDNGDGTISKSPLLDFYVNFKLLRDLELRIGQYKVPYSRQRVVSSGNQQFVDRTIANGEFTLDRDLGFDIRSKNLGGLDLFRYYAGIWIGEGHSSYEMGDFGNMYIARFEVMPMGTFDDYKESDHKRLKKARLSIGAAYAFVDEGKGNRGITGSTPADGGTTDTHNVTADVAFREAGFSLDGAFFWRQGRRNVPADDDRAIDDNGMFVAVEDPRDGVGYYAQAGLLVPNTGLEFAARFGGIGPAASGTSLSASHELGGAVSYYLARHNLKLQADYFRLWGDEELSEGSGRFRVQLQAAY